MTKFKHVGIVAVSAEGAALCYRTICVEAARLLGAYAHPEIDSTRTVARAALREATVDTSVPRY
jgi:hypothetical protein